MLARARTMYNLCIYENHWFLNILKPLSKVYTFDFNHNTINKKI